MVATVVRLRARILVHTLRREPWRWVILVLGLVWVVAMLPSVVFATSYLGRSTTEIAEPALVLAGSLVVLGWVVVPVLLPSLDDSLEVRRFATTFVPLRRLLPGLLAASLLGVPTLVTAAFALVPAIAWFGIDPRAGAVALAAWPLGWGTCVLGARLSTGTMTRVLGSRRSRELAVLGALAVVGLAIPALASLGGTSLDAAVARVPDATRVLGWTPLGLPWSAPAAVAGGDLGGGLLRLGLAALVVAAAGLLWVHVRSGPSSSGRRRRAVASGGTATRRRRGRAPRPVPSPPGPGGRGPPTRATRGRCSPACSAR